MAKTQTGAKSTVREYAEAIIIALILALIIRTFIIQAFKIPSGSMLPTLQIGDHLLVNKFMYGFREPFTGTVIIPVKDVQRNDIIVFRFPRDPRLDYIKRVVAVGGDTVEGRDKVIYVNGEPYDDKYAVHLDSNTLNAGNSPRDNFGPVTVPESK
ncbi:MAG: signal peptidase I, partial [Desulfobulbaceae bacterium]